MRLFFASPSPFVRKVMVCAFELGLEDRIERLSAAAHPIDRDMAIVAENPLGKVPTLLTNEGIALFDSRVICEYLADKAGSDMLFPNGPARWTALRDQALADGLLDAAILARYEHIMRPEELVWQRWSDGQIAKIESALDHLAEGAAALAGRIDIGTISIGCALGYLDFRFAHLNWRLGRGGLAEWFEMFSRRPSMEASRPF